MAGGTMNGILRIRHRQGIRLTVGELAALLLLMLLFPLACRGEVEVTREVPVTVEATREVPVTVEVTREVPVTVEATREVPVTVEVTREIPIAASSQQGQAMTGSRIELVRDRGHLICASRNDLPGWGWVDREGNNVGFDIDLCRAVAAAVLGDPSAIEIRLITARERGPTIVSADVDLMVRTVTWTSARDASWGAYPQIMFFDGQGFMVRKGRGVNSALELQNATVCVVLRTTTELNLYNFSRRNGLDLKVLALEDTDSVIQTYEEDKCDAFTNDHSQLAPLRTFALDNPDDHVILPEFISEEPLAPVVPHGDEQWADIVRAVMGILIWAEAHSITSDAVPTAPTGSDAVDRLFGLHGSWGQEMLGLSQAVALDVIEAVGNYGEIFDRNLGTFGLSLVRENSRNALWQAAPCTDCPKGGQIYAPPLR